MSKDTFLQLVLDSIMSTSVLSQTAGVPIGEPKFVESAELPTKRKIKPFLPTQIVTDVDLGLVQGAKHLPVDLDRLHLLLTDDHSVHLVGRHLAALKKVLRHYNYGIPYGDLVGIFKVLNVLADRSELQPAYLPAVAGLAKLCQYPFLSEKTSDELIYNEISAQSLSQLAYLMRVPSMSVKMDICRSVLRFSGGDRDFALPQPPLGFRYTPLEKCRYIVRSSDCAESFVQSLALVDDDFTSKLTVLQLLLHLSRDGYSNCSKMLFGGAISEICTKLIRPGATNEDERLLLFMSAELLWNILETICSTSQKSESNDKVLKKPMARIDLDAVSTIDPELGAMVIEQLDRTCLENIRQVLYDQLTKGYHSQYDRQLRNDLVCCIGLLTKICGQAAPFVQTGLVRNLILYATFEEVKSHNVLVKHLKYGTNHEDFEFRKLLFTVLVIFAQRDPSVIPLLSEGQLLLALFNFCVPVPPLIAHQNPRQWSPSQFEELQLLALACLEILAPRLVTDYMALRGNARLITLLEWATDEKMKNYLQRPISVPRNGYREFLGTGNSFHGTGGRATRKSQVLFCLRVLVELSRTYLPDMGSDATQVQRDLVDQGFIQFLIAIVNKITEDDSLTVDIHINALALLGFICDQDVHCKELFGESGIDMVIRILKTSSTRLTSGIGHHKLTIMALDTIWSCILGSVLNEDIFFEQKGIFLLIDLVEKCPHAIRGQTLGLLSDLFENTKSLAHANTWRGTANLTFAHLLCDLWRATEKYLGVRRTEDGAIADVNCPISTQHQLDCGVMPVPSKAITQSIADIFENQRARIFSLFTRLGFHDLPGLTPPDYVTLQIIERYLDLKVGEIWTEITCELQMEQLEPVDADKEVLSLIERGVVEKVEETKQVQQEIITTSLQQEIADEQEMYNRIRERSRQRDRAFAYYHNLVARTSKYNLLKEAKQAQLKSIEASRISENYRSSTNFHSTDVDKLNVTAFAGRYLAVQSTPNLHANSNKDSAIFAAVKV